MKCGTRPLARGAWLTKAGHRTRINYAPETYNVFPSREEKEKRCHSLSGRPWSKE